MPVSGFRFGPPAEPSAAWEHGSEQTISGTFPAKTTAAPYIWDDCEGSDPGWSAKWPSTKSPSDNAFQFLMDYRTPAAVGRGVTTAHSRVSKYLCANAAGTTGAGTGSASMMWKTYTKSDGMTLYASWYERADPNWIHDTFDRNFKYWAISEGAYYGGDYAYFDYQGNTFGSTFGCTMNDDSVSNGGGLFFHGPGSATDNCGQDWNFMEGSVNGKNFLTAAIKREVVCKVSSSAGTCESPGGWWRLLLNGVAFARDDSRMFAGRTDGAPDTTRAWGFGGYNRAYGAEIGSEDAANNWRYFNDLYFDMTCIRLVATNDASYASNYGVSNSERIVEPQIPSAWSTGSITFNVNLGKLVADTTAYLFVHDGSDVPTEVGSFTVGA